jgi:hypothetical protein
LNRIDNFDWVPVALELFRVYGNKPVELGDKLEQLERLTASMFIRRRYVNQRIDRIAPVLRAIADKEDPSAPLALTDEEKLETKTRLDGPLYLETKTRLYVLLRLDSVVSGGGATYDYPQITVEHVLPQNPKPGSTWLDNFSKDEREGWTHRLGNLLLLTRRKNSEAQNFEFTEKKERYFKGKNGISPFAITTDVLNESEWTPAVVRRRQECLIVKLEQLWLLR